MYQPIFNNLIFPLLERCSRTTIKNHLREINASQWSSKEYISNLQDKKLSSIIQHCYENVPYYRRIFKESNITPSDVKTKEDLKKIPALTKKMIKRNLNYLIAQNINKSNIFELHSSGSTGEPLKYYLDVSSYSAAWAQTFRCWEWAGYQLGDPYVKLSGNKRTTISKKIQDILFRTKYIYSFGINEDNIINIIQQIKKFQPTVIRGYASYMYIIAGLMEKMDLFLDGPSIATTGDMLFPHYRKKIEERFNCKVFDGYGGETTPIGFECERHAGYHLCNEDVIVEFIQQNDDVQAGEPGKIVVTNLNNYCMPFIRYEIGDIGIPDGGLCSCGRGLELMRSIEGRDSDILTTPSGDYVMVHYFTILFEYVEGIEQFQIIQESIDKLVIKLVINPQFSERDQEFIVQQIRSKFGEEIDLSIEIVDTIPGSGSAGKRRFVISKVPLKF